MISLRRRLATVLTAALFACAAPVTSAQEASEPQATTQDKQHAAKLRATVILRMAPFLATPGLRDPEKKYRICVVGKDPLGLAILRYLPGRSVGKHEVEVVQVDPAVAAATTRRTYDLVYVAITVDPATTAKIIERHRKIATPLVCERPGFAASGGGIQLFVRKNKVRFEINRDALERQGVKPSPQLMKLSVRGPRR